MTVQDIQFYLAMARDGALLLLLLLVIVTGLILYRKISAVLDSARRSINDVEQIVSAVSKKLVKPATTASGLASGVSKIATFLATLFKNEGKVGGT